MATDILIKRSTTPGAVPTTSDLSTGELAINTADKRLFTNNAGTIVEIGTAPSSLAVTNNATVGGTLGVTGNTTLSGTLSAGATTLASGSVSGNFVVTGTLTVATPSNSTDAASKGYVDAQVSAVIDSAPAALDTLNELAAALGDDANFATTVTNALAGKLALTGGTMTGNIVMGSNKVTSTATPSSADDLTRKGYVDSILGSATDAATSASEAASSASDAADSASAAATSASNASTSASNAATSASNASTSETNAASSATAASNSATSASNSATAASNSASAAATSATNAENAYDSFDDRYLGAKASDPSVDNDGDALLTGALYFNTGNNTMRVYNGSAWEDVVDAVINLVDDTTPQLGGNLDLNSNDITGTGNIDVTGTVTADGLTVDGAGTAVTLQANNGAGTLNTLQFRDSDTATATGQDIGVIEFYSADASDAGVQAYIKGQAAGASGIGRLVFGTGSGTSTVDRLLINSNGDINLGYEDTGTTPKLFWDASAERLGIGTSSPSSLLHLSANGAVLPRISSADGLGDAALRFYSGVAFKGQIGWDQGNDVIGIYTASSSFTPTISVSGNNVGIGTSSPDAPMTIQRPSNNQGVSAGISLKGQDGTTQGGLGTDGVNDNAVQLVANQFIKFHTNNTDGTTNERMRIDSSGNVGIGTTSPGAKLDVQSADSNVASFEHADGGLSQVSLVSNSGSAYLQQTGGILSFFIGGTAGTAVSGSEAMRIDSSGNLLVGTTDTDTSNNASGTGISMGAVGYISIARNASTPLLVNRQTTDGDIISFRKDGTTVGSIGTTSSDLTIGSTSTRVRFDDNGAITPRNSSDANSDATIDLGQSAGRFKDLYLSGGVYLGGTGAANHLDDYEEGTWTPVIVGGTTAGTGTYDSQQGIYTKVGNLVMATCWIAWTAHTGTGDFIISGLPFNAVGSATLNLQAGSIYASGFNAGTNATQLITYPQGGASNILFRGFVNNALRTVPTIDNAGQIGVTITYRVA